MKKYLLVLFAALNFIACKSSSKNEAELTGERIEIQHKNVRFPEPIGFVNDFDTIFTADQGTDLENFLRNYEQQTSHHIAVVTVNTIKPYHEIQWYATDLANYWGIGKKEKDNGLLILLDNNEREIWISTGIGTEKILTDEVLKNIIDSTIIPEFVKGNYFNGIVKGIEDITVRWE